MDITTAVLLIDMVMKYRDRAWRAMRPLRLPARSVCAPILMTQGSHWSPCFQSLSLRKRDWTPINLWRRLGRRVARRTILSLFDIPIMHTYVDDLTRWLNKTLLNRNWHWPVTELDPIPALQTLLMRKASAYSITPWGMSPPGPKFGGQEIYVVRFVR